MQKNTVSIKSVHSSGHFHVLLFYIIESLKWNNSVFFFVFFTQIKKKGRGRKEATYAFLDLSLSFPVLLSFLCACKISAKLQSPM